MVRVREKKAKGDDAFTTRKQKVGRKKLAPVTATRAEVHARTLRITAPHQALQTTVEQSEAARDDKELKRPPRSFKEELAATTHYRAPTKRGAFFALSKIVAGKVKGEPECSPVQMLQLVSSALEAMTDNEREVRDGVEAALTAVLDVPGSIAGPLPALIVRNLLIVLTHANGGVKKCGLRFLGDLLLKAPGTLRDLTTGDGAALVARGMDPVEDLRALVRHATELGAAKTACRELSLLLRELSGTRVMTPEFGVALYDAMIDVLGTAWKECMELRHALFRHPVMCIKAISIAEIFHEMVPLMVKWRALNNVRGRHLRDLIVSQVPFTQSDLATHTGAESRDFSLALAKAQSTQLQVAECMSGVTAYLAEALTTHRHRNYRAAVELLTEVVRDDDACAACVPLLELLMSSFQEGLGENINSAIVRAVPAVVRRFFEVCPSDDAAKRLAAVLERVPRLLFSARVMRDGDRQHIAAQFVELIWSVFAQLHPAAAFVDQRRFALSLTSIFGVKGIAEGILATCDADVVATAASIFTFFDASALPQQQQQLPAPVVKKLEQRDAVAIRCLSA